MLTQVEADRLFSLAKIASNAAPGAYPSTLGGKLELPLQSLDGSEAFSLNVTLGRKSIGKTSWQIRTRSSVVIARLDFGGPPHRNPDCKIIETPHFHRYREGHGDSWAYQIQANSTDEQGLKVPDIGAGQKAWFEYFLDCCKVRRVNIVEWPEGVSF